MAKDKRLKSLGRDEASRAQLSQAIHPEHSGGGLAFGGHAAVISVAGIASPKHRMLQDTSTGAAKTY
jgi:hypothetical protein